MSKKWVMQSNDNGYRRGDFGLYERTDRGDLMTILPMWYVEKNQRYFLGVNNETNLEPVEENQRA